MSARSRAEEPAGQGGGGIQRLERPAPLSQQAYERIRRLLLAGEEVPERGRLGERELADQLAMSRTPVRDALRRLSLAGLIEPAPGGGYVTRRASLRDVREYYDLRMLLEPYAARLATERDPGDRVRAFSAKHLEGEASPEANARFHAAVADASGNRVLAQVIRALIDRLASQRIFARGDGVSSDTLSTGHESVAEAIRTGDPDAASAAMERHLTLARDLLVSELRDLEAPGD